VTSLRELQLAFAQALTNPPSGRAAALVAAAGIPAAQRLQIYRNNFVVSLGEALEAVFPVVQRLVGAQFFRYAARRYVNEVPSISGDIHAFGATFPSHLAELPQAHGLAYLPDVARLEWAYHEVFHAADAPPLGLECLVQVPPDHWSSLRLAITPASALLRSPYPIVRIWQVNQEDWRGEATVNLEEGGGDVLVLRQRGTVALSTLLRGELELLNALADGQPLERSLDAALQSDGAFDLAASLRRLFLLGIFVELGAS